MAEGDVTPAGGEDSGSPLWWLGGLLILGGAGFTAWYYLVHKKSTEVSDVKPKGDNSADIKAPDAQTDPTQTEDKSAVRGSEKKSPTPAAATSTTPVTTGGSTYFPVGMKIKADGDQSIQRMKVNKSSGGKPVAKDDSGKDWGYSKVTDGELLGTVSVSYDNGILVKSPAGYRFPYYYVTYDQILGIV